MKPHHTLLAVLFPLFPTSAADYTVHPEQTIMGIGFKIQSDSIGSGNQGWRKNPSPCLTI